MISDKDRRYIIANVKRVRPYISVDDIRSELDLQLLEYDHSSIYAYRECWHIYHRLLNVFGSRAWVNSDRGKFAHCSYELLDEDRRPTSPSGEDEIAERLDCEIMIRNFSPPESWTDQYKEWCIDFIERFLNGERSWEIAADQKVDRSTVGHKKAKLLRSLKKTSGLEHYF